MNTTPDSVSRLLEAQGKAEMLFEESLKRGYIAAGKSEKKLNHLVYELAFELFGIKKFWHKRIVRAGKNTLLPYKENPPDLIIKDDDILFFDFGPVFEDWEADVGKTYVIGGDPTKHKLQRDTELMWEEGKNFYLKHPDSTGAEFYKHTQTLAAKYGWEFGNIHCGHLIGNFPHETVLGEEVQNYIHPENHEAMGKPDKFGNKRHWIYEVHLVDVQKEIGGFYEKMLC